VTERNIAIEMAIQASHKVREANYWQKKLSGNWVKSVFPPDYNRKIQDTSGDSPGKVTETFTFSFPSDLYRRLITVSNKSDAKLNMTLISGIIMLLYKYTGNRDIIVGTPVYKQKLEGQFVNTVLPLRNRIAPHISFKDLLLQVRHTIREAIENQNYPMEALLQQLGLSSTGKEDFPLFDIAVLLENIQKIEYIQHLQLNIIFLFSRTKDSLQGMIEYNSSLYNRTFIQRLVSHFFRMMAEALANVDLKISAIDILTPEEKTQQLVEFNNSSAVYPRHMPIPKLFEKQVLNTPNHIAVVFGEHKVTYGTLNRRANQLAWKLRKKGVGPDTVIGVMMDRSIDMIVALLAVLKAGGGYLPIDPEWPQYRTLQILDGSRAPIFLTNRGNIQTRRFTHFQGLNNALVRIHQTKSRPQITDLDRLPIPDRSLINYEKYNKNIGQMGVNNIIAMQATRGCPFNCLYCHKIWPKSHIFRSAEHIFAEVKIYYDMGVRRFSFVDDIFNLNKENSRRFLELVIKNKLDIQLFFGLRGDILTEDYIDLMVEAGTVRMALALETASPRLQKLIGKNLNIRKLHRNLQYICQKHPQVILELNTMLGFPTETEAEAMMTLNFIKSLKWIHFPNVNILKIYPNTEMEALAVQMGIPRKVIAESEDLAYHELPATLPFSNDFVIKYQSEFLNDYFLSKERFLHVLPRQMKIFTEKEIVQKYDSYMPFDINRFDDLLQVAGIKREELTTDTFLEEDSIRAPHLHEKMKQHFSVNQRKDENESAGFKVLLLDLSQYYSNEVKMLYDIVEPPLGLMYVMTYLQRQLGDRVIGKIAKSRVDFDSARELKALLEDFAPQVIGIRSLTFFSHFFHQTAALIRHWGFQGPIIAGGPYATSDYEKILRDRNLDLVVLGEGEVTFTEVVEKIIENHGQLPDEEILKGIAGIAFAPQRTWQQQKQAFSREVIMLDQLDLTNQPGENLAQINHPDDLAYIIFTSGSTGNPKGVMIQHRNVANVVSWFSHRYQLRYKTNVLQMSDYTFDASVNQVFGSLLHGATLHLIDKNLLLNVDALRLYIKANQIHLLNFAPVLFKELLTGKEKLESIRAVISGGEKLDDPLKDAILEKGYDLYNQYGPSETTIDALAEKCSGKPVTLGTPIANTQCYILSKEKNLLPLGIIGELYAAGDGLARGYLNQPELTAERFIEQNTDAGDRCRRTISNKKFLQGVQGGSFFKKRPPGCRRLYKTGDLVRLTREGNFEFWGRIDNQVKIRGFRIELNEIENQLLKHGNIKEAVVVERTKKDRCLCAFIVSPSHLREFKNELYQYLQQRLPHYMVPAHIFQLSKLPLTSSGKVDRKALLSLEVDTGTKEEYQAPADEIEVKMTALWAEVLQIKEESLSSSANFFELGGHSLTAVTLLNKIHEVFHTKIQLTDIFQIPTIKAVSRIIRESTGDEFCPIKPIEKKEYYPLTSAQERLYLVQQMEVQRTSYNIYQMIHLGNDLDKGRLEKAFKELIKRHESLRTSFTIIADEPVQKIQDHVDFTLEYYDRTRSVALPAEIEKITNSFVRPFDLSQAPLFRVRLTATPEKSILMVDMHHITSDGTSHGVLKEEFLAAYKGDELPALRVQYKDYALWQERQLNEEKPDQQKEYWLKKLENFQFTRLPRDKFDSYTRVQGKVENWKIETSVAEKIERFCKQQNVTRFVLMIAVFQMVLAGETGQKDITIATPVSIRDHSDLKKIIGIFLNVLLIRSIIDESDTFLNYLAKTKATVIEALNNKHYPYEVLHYNIKQRDRLKDNELFTILFNYFPAAQEQETIDLDPEPQLADTMEISPKFDVNFYIRDAHDEIQLSLVYISNLFDDSRIKRIMDNFYSIITSVVEDETIKMADINIQDAVGIDGFGQDMEEIAEEDDLIL
jgi:amino acid adenylation domain-containing protein